MWTVHMPKKVVFGEDALDELPELQGERAIIITDPTLKGLEFLENALIV